MVEEKRTGRRFAGWVLAVLLLVSGLGVAAVLNRQYVEDRIAAARFEPTAEVDAVRERLQLTDAGDLVFLASAPTLVSSQRFNEQCAGVDHSDDGHVLGCFAAGRIHLFQVTDERLFGVVEVTAAHELLHATYSRLSAEERRELAPALESAYADAAEADPELKERMSLYEGLSRPAFVNELHSVLGTEVAELPAELEEHYAAWFRDRAAIVSHFADYHGVFSALQQEAAALEQEMQALAAQIEERSAGYQAAVADYNHAVQRFRERNENYEFSGNPTLFDSIRDDLDAQREGLEAERAALNAEIDRYNGLRDRLSELSETSAELDRTIDSSLAPPAE